MLIMNDIEYIDNKGVFLIVHLARNFSKYLP